MRDSPYRNLYRKGGFERCGGLSVRGSGGGMTRGRFLAAAGSLLLVGGAGGCGGGSSGGDGGGSGDGGRDAIRHRYGNTEIATWDWAQDELGAAEPEFLSSAEMNFERIAALEPDLILGVTSGMTRDEYDTLSEIAPTVGQSGEYVDYGVPWQEATRITGRALGRERRAEEEVSEVEGRFQETRAEHQGFENATGVVALYGENGSFSAYGPEDTRGRFMSALGFELPDEISELAGDQFYAEISTERLDLLDADVLVVIVPDDGREALGQDELYQQLAVVREERTIVLETSDTLAGALSFGTVLSLPYLLNEMVPRLSRSLAG